VIDAINSIINLPTGTLPVEVAQSLIGSFEWEGIEFFPLGKYSYKAEQGSLKTKGLDNMRVTFGTGETAKLKISNSLHKIYHDGRNDNDFTKNELIATIHYLESVFGLPLDSFRLSGDIEFGVNIPVKDANYIIEQCHRYNDKPMLPMLGKSKVYGKKVFTSKYNVKLYNPIKKLLLEDSMYCKALGIKDENNILRIEIQAKAEYIRNSWKVPLYNLCDLMQDEVLTKLGQRLITLSKNVVFNNKPPILDYKEAKIWSFFMNASEAEHQQYRKDNRTVYYKDKKILKDLKEANNPIDLIPLITEKWTFLQMN
jgi:hypothetical protein